MGNDENYVINPADAPLFYEGDNNVYFMMHSDSDFNNKTPSMMAQLYYTFDKPTTTLYNTKANEPNARKITLTCTNGTTGNCNNTFYKLNANEWTTYTNPFNIILQGNNTIQYYSTGDNNNIETTSTTTINVIAQPSTGACGLIILVEIVIAAVLLIAIGLAVTLGGANISPAIILGLVVTAISTIIAVIIFANITMPFCGI